jgi:hypothetical protein
MKNHVKTARGHCIIALCYVLLATLLLWATPGKADIDWHLVVLFAVGVAAHCLLAWGAWRARNWARSLTLFLAFPLLLVAPFGTLAAILLISYCGAVWAPAVSPPA